MKKVLLLAAFSLSFLATAKNTQVKSQNIETSGRNVNLQRKALWNVPIMTPCGPVNVYFWSNYADGTAEFITDLAYSVNYVYDHCGVQGIEFN